MSIALMESVTYLPEVAVKDAVIKNMALDVSESVLNNACIVFLGTIALFASLGSLGNIAFKSAQ
jgi:hypothetical protein